jgi:hypothetical protein
MTICDRCWHLDQKPVHNTQYLDVRVGDPYAISYSSYHGSPAPPMYSKKMQLCSKCVGIVTSLVQEVCERSVG